MEQIVNMTGSHQCGPGQCVCLMDQEIPGTLVYYHRLEKGRQITLPARADGVDILLLCQGRASVCNGGRQCSLDRRGIFAARPEEPTVLKCAEACELLRLVLLLTEEELRALRQETLLPYCQAYDRAPTYSENCKSTKTISRMLLPQRIVPRLAMGSVESHGRDTVASHKHPMLEQYFFGLSENNCSLLIDGVPYRFPGSTLLHIPLGSSHGVRAEEGECIHYIWMDCLLNEEALRYMDAEHHLNP